MFEPHRRTALSFAISKQISISCAPVVGAEPDFHDAATYINDRFLRAAKNVTKSNRVLLRVCGRKFFNALGRISASDKNDRFWHKNLDDRLKQPETTQVVWRIGTSLLHQSQPYHLASLELSKGSAQQALTEIISTERKLPGSTPERPRSRFRQVKR